MDSSQLHRPMSTLHQVMKYVDEDGKVRTLIAVKHPFKGIENYFIDYLIYQDSLKTNEYPQLEDSDFGNKADTEPGLKKNFSGS